VVADGMGGRDFGEVASSLCVSTLNKTFKKYCPETLRGRSAVSDPVVANAFKQTLDTWLRDVNKAVHGFGAIDDRYQEMGTTVALVYHQEDFVVVAHVGDSRVYRVRDGGIEQITEDHSFVNAQLRAGLISEEEAERSPYRNIITRAIGTGVKCKADVNVFPAEPGDLYLLCSDGLSDLANGKEILATMQMSDLDLQRSVQALIDLANERGGKDNITVLIARLDSDDDDDSNIYIPD